MNFAVSAAKTITAMSAVSALYKEENMKKIKRILPILIAFILAFGIVTVAWVIQDAQMTGIRITSTTDGVSLQIKMSDDVSASFTNTLVVPNFDLTLKPSVWDGNGFYDVDGNYVTNNRQYVRSFTIQVLPEQNCIIKATKTVVGDLPVNVVCEGQNITSDTNLGQSGSIKPLTFYVYVDGENFTGQATSEVSITLHGDNV